jgi:hypothetical protein
MPRATSHMCDVAGREDLLKAFEHGTILPKIIVMEYAQ